MNVFNYNLDESFYLDTWISKNTDVGRTSISTNLINCFNEALQHYNKEKYKVTVSSVYDLESLDEEGLSPLDVEERATLEKHKYWGLAPTIDWTCRGYSLINGLAKVERGEGDHTQILSGYTYNNTNTGVNILTVEGVDDYFRYGTGSFSNTDIYEEYMTKRCLFAPNNSEIVFYVELEPFYNSQWFAGANAYYATYDLDKDDYIEAKGKDDIKNKYIDRPDECLVIKNFWAYSKTGLELPRTLINKNSLNKDKETTPYVEFVDKFYKPLYVPVWGILLDGCCPNYGQINLWNSNTPKLLFTPYLHKYGYFKERPLLRMKINTIGSNKPLDEHRFSFAIGTKAEFKKLFDDLGLKVTFNRDEAINVPVEEWEDVPVTPPVEPELPDLPDLPNLIDPEIPDTPNRPTDGHANGNGGQEGGEVDNEVKPPLSPESDLQEDGSDATGYQTTNISWAMTSAEVIELNRVFQVGSLWTNMSAWFNKPEDAIVNLLKFPFSLPMVSADHIAQEDQTVIVGGVALKHEDGEVKGRIMHHKFKTRIKVGEFTFKRFFNSFLDYSPYTKIKICLPFLGQFIIDPDFVNDKTVELYYNISWTDGSCIAILKLAPKDGGHIIGVWSGQIGIDVPIVKSNMLENTKNVMKSVTNAAGGVVMGAVTGGPAGAIAGAVNGVSTAMNSIKPNSMSSDKIQANHSRALPLQPYIIFERPITNMTKNYTQIRGIATNIYKPLKELAGFTVCKNVKLDNLARALSSEVNEIRSLLESGVILGKPNK